MPSPHQLASSSELQGLAHAIENCQPYNDFNFYDKMTILTNTLWTDVLYSITIVGIQVNRQL